MSEKTIKEIQKRIDRIQKLTKSESDSKKKKSGKYGSYQHFQSECMKKIDPNNPNSPSVIGEITGEENAHSSKKMAMCAMKWKEYRGLNDPVEGLKQELKQKGGNNDRK
jgi:hypothetical protein